MKTNIKMLNTFQWLAFNSTSYSFYTTFGYHPYTYYIDVLFQGNAKKKAKKKTSDYCILFIRPTINVIFKLRTNKRKNGLNHAIIHPAHHSNISIGIYKLV